MKSLRVNVGAILHEPIFPIIQFIYQDLLRTGVRDHLLGRSYGLTDESSAFTSQLLLTLGMSKDLLTYFLSFNEF